LLCQAYADEIHPKGESTYQKVTGDDAEDDSQRWDRVYKTESYVFGKEPSAFLKENVHLLKIGRALDIATGEGRNAVFLAKKGFNVDGVDLSEVGLRKARALARENRVTIHTLRADLTNYSIPAETYDVILDMDYLQRSLIPGIKRGLKKGGVVVFENQTLDPSRAAPGKQVPRDIPLKRGELKELFQDFEVLLYRETQQGKEAKASLIARKPAGP
jgi:SAM-dependent methyltransferase